MPYLSVDIPGLVSGPTILDMSNGNGPDLLGKLVAILSNALGANLTLVGQNSCGAVVLGGYDGGYLVFIPTALQNGNTLGDGVWSSGNGEYLVVTGNTAITVFPSLVNLCQLAALLPAGSKLQMAWNGVLSATVNGVSYAVQPGVLAQLAANPGGAHSASAPTATCASPTHPATARYSTRPFWCTIPRPVTARVRRELEETGTELSSTR